MLKDGFGRKIHVGVAGIFFFVVVLFFACKESLQIFPQGFRSLETKGRPYHFGKGVDIQNARLHDGAMLGQGDEFTTRLWND
jgi:hypothetical protein